MVDNFRIVQSQQCSISRLFFSKFEQMIEPNKTKRLSIKLQ